MSSTTTPQPPLPGVFDDFDDAQQAREALLAEGFDREQLELLARQDDGGPVEGSFIAGNVKDDTVNRTAFSQRNLFLPQHSYEHNFERQVERGGLLIVVIPRDDGQRAKAREILRRHGARIPVQPAAP